MGAPSCSDEEFVALFEKWGGEKAAVLLGIATANVYRRRRRLEEKLGRLLTAPTIADERKLSGYPMRNPLTICDGVFIAGSDAHYEPGSDKGSVAHRGLVKLCRELKPKAVLLNGDVLDFPDASKHDQIGWTPSRGLKEELEAGNIRMSEIEDAAGPGASFLFTIGNHDLRFESYLSGRAPAMEGVMGVRLADHFPRWKIGISVWINEGELVCKHRYKGGTHATHNNVVNSGKSMLTGHLHSLKVTPFSDYNGTRYGIDTGTLNDPYGEHASYAEDNPLNHRSGFVVCTFHRGRLLLPEIAQVWDENHIQFRGQLIEV